jgi:hypothetical protein
VKSVAKRKAAGASVDTDKQSGPKGAAIYVVQVNCEWSELCKILHALRAVRACAQHHS